MKRKRREYRWPVTAGLVLFLIFLISVLWALFIAGPARQFEVQNAKVVRAIQKEVPEVKGLERTVFDYVTWEGYTADTLYWFDATGKQITSRPMESLDYEGARQRALEDWDIAADTIQLAFGYNSPVYEIQGSGQMLMLDYDTLERVYQRQVRS